MAASSSSAKVVTTVTKTTRKSSPSPTRGKAAPIRTSTVLDYYVKPSASATDALAVIKKPANTVAILPLEKTKVDKNKGDCIKCDLERQKEHAREKKRREQERIRQLERNAITRRPDEYVVVKTKKPHLVERRIKTKIVHWNGRVEYKEEITYVRA